LCSAAKLHYTQTVTLIGQAEPYLKEFLMETTISTTGRNPRQLVLIASAALLLVAFFLSWVNIGGGGPSGLAIASTPNALVALGAPEVGLAALLYAVPVLATLALVIAFVRWPATGMLSAGLGFLVFLLLSIFLVQLNKAPEVVAFVSNPDAPGTILPFIGIGLWLALICSTVIFVNGLIAGAETAQGIDTRTIAVAGLLGSLTVTLAATGLGFIPVPNIVGAATILHLPVIVGAVIEGPLVGTLIGLLFGIFSILIDTTGLFSGNPHIAIIPRLVIGLTSWLTYRSLARFNTDLAAAAAGAVGTLTNTILVVGMLVTPGIGPLPAAVIPAIIPQAIAELILAVILTPIIVRAVNITRSGRLVAPEQGPREKQYF
jgi:uncharacterized membrane protein